MPEIKEDLQKADWGMRRAIMDDVDGVSVVTYQDTAPILEANNDDLNSGHNGDLKGGWGRHVARIPLGVIAQWKQLYGVDLFNKNHVPAVRRLLNSNEWRYLRCAPGAL